MCLWATIECVSYKSLFGSLSWEESENIDQLVIGVSKLLQVDLSKLLQVELLQVGLSWEESENTY